MVIDPDKPKPGHLEGYLMLSAVTCCNLIFPKGAFRQEKSTAPSAITALPAGQVSY